MMKEQAKQISKIPINPNTSLLERYIQNSSQAWLEEIDAKELAGVIKSLLQEGDLSPSNIN